tara:strand:+ start:113 stop:388 length:276 start_codon:yes stop_codon:yes gene_type:complete
MPGYKDWVSMLEEYSKDAIVQVKTDKGEWVKATFDQALAWIRYLEGGVDRRGDKYTVYVKEWRAQGIPEKVVIRNNRKKPKTTREIRALTA